VLGVLVLLVLITEPLATLHCLVALQQWAVVVEVVSLILLQNQVVLVVVVLESLTLTT
jgi:hypothetical protein